MTRSLKFRAAFLLLGLHAVVLAFFGASLYGPLLSDSIQLLLGLVVVWCCLDAGRVSVPYARYLWRVAAFSFSIWCFSQGLGVFMDLFTRGPDPALIQWYSAVFSELWFLPLGLTLFISPEQTSISVDWVVILDILQTGVILAASFLFFFLFPLHNGSLRTDLANGVRDPYFLLHAAIVAAFAVRAIFDKNSHTRNFFRAVTIYLCCSMSADLLYFYTPLHDARTGSWFDFVWSAVLCVAVITFVDWKQTYDRTSPEHADSSTSTLLTQFFPLVFPLLVLTLSSQLSAAHRTAAFAVVLVSYACLSARLLVTHNRLDDLQRSLEHRASHDLLTGLQNRAAILDILDRELKRSQRTGSPVGVVMLDADHFKALNDKYGHLTGDRVLEFLGSELKRTIRPYDSAGRYGGEEFLLVLPESDVAESAAFANRVREQVDTSPLDIDGHHLHYTVSCGVACSSGSATLEDLLRAADRALYSAKSLGRNRVEVAAQVDVPANLRRS